MRREPRRFLAAAALLTAGAAAAASSPFSFDDADLSQAWRESAASFATPSFDDYLAERNRAFVENIPRLFEAGAPAPKPESPRTTARERAETHSFTEVEAAAGSEGRMELAGFQGWEIKFVDAAVSFRESRATSGDGLYDNDRLRAGAEVALSDEAGTTIGFGADFEGASDKLRRDPAGGASLPEKNLDRSGGGTVGFRSNLWGKAKFATEIAATFSEGEYASYDVVDQKITADSSYDFFWLGDYLSRAFFTLSQGNNKVAADECGFLFGRLGLENDFPIAHRLYLSGGFATYLYRHGRPEFRFYPRGRLLLRLTPNWGYFIHYRPRLRVPDFRELYVHADYVLPTAFRPVEDEHFVVRSGFNYHFRNLGHVTAAVYERRLRRTYALTDTSPAPAAAYFDPGNVRLRGADLFYRVTLARVEHYGGAAYTVAALCDTPERRLPYRPTYEGKAGLTYKFGPGHAASVEATFLGERYPSPEATAPLRGAWIPGADVVFRVRPGIYLTAAAENLTDEKYYVPGRVLGPARSFHLGIHFTL